LLDAGFELVFFEITFGFEIHIVGIPAVVGVVYGEDPAGFEAVGFADYVSGGEIEPVIGGHAKGIAAAIFVYDVPLYDIAGYG
jgi:hypothetical protein